MKLSSFLCAIKKAPPYNDIVGLFYLWLFSYPAQTVILVSILMQVGQALTFFGVHDDA
jgi:hypothetical protein